jgi:hypothetical protein
MGEDMTEFDAERVANDMSKPGKFNLVERLQNRGMPTEDVDVYLDEKNGWNLLRLEEKHNEAKKKEELAEIEAAIARVKRALADSKYVFTLQGVSNERYDELIKQAEDAYPVEYEEHVNPLTAEKIKTPIDNEDRDRLFNNIFLADVITKVTDPDGGVDDEITVESVEFIKRLAPLDAIARITRLAFQMRMATAWMDSVQDEDFSPRP